MLISVGHSLIYTEKNNEEMTSNFSEMVASIMTVENRLYENCKVNG